MNNNTFLFFILFIVLIAAAGCVDIRERQRAECAEDGGRYVQMDEFDDDICLLPNGDAYGFDD